MRRSTCPSDEDLARWVESGLDAGTRQEAIEHLASCRACRWCWMECRRTGRAAIEGPDSTRRSVQ